MDAKKKHLTLRQILLFAVVGAIVGAPGHAPAQLTPHGVKAEGFIEYITVANPYRKWETWPGRSPLSKATAPQGHGTLISTFVNPAAYGSIAEKKGMHDGSIIVVENYDSEKKLTGLTAMYKVSGYNPKAGDWYWVAATPGGRVTRFGKVQPCIDCHRTQARNDYVWTDEIVKGEYDRAAVP